MKKGLQERFARFHASFPLDDVYLQLPRAVRNDAYLYLLALNGHQRAKEADADVPVVIAKELARMMGLSAERMLSSLEAIVDKEGSPRIISRSSAHVRLLKYSKWQDLPEEIAELKAKRSEAGKVGGLNSAKARAAQASGVPSAQADAVALGTPLAKPPLQQRSSKPQAEREIEREGEIRTHGDVVTEVANGARPAAGASLVVGRLLDWLCVKHAWSTIARDTFLREEPIAKQIGALGMPWSELESSLNAMWDATDADDRPSTLGYFWTRLQDQQHARTKQQGRSHARTDTGFTRVKPAAAARGGRR